MSPLLYQLSYTATIVLVVVLEIAEPTTIGSFTT